MYFYYSSKLSHFSIQIVLHLSMHSQQSPYWLEQAEIAHSYLRRNMEFRQQYKRKNRPSLCEAINGTYESLSTDPMDKIYA